MLELRQNSGVFLRWLKQGRHLILTYRGKPVARVEPIRKIKKDQKEDPLFKIHQFAQASSLGPLDHENIDAIVYEHP